MIRFGTATAFAPNQRYARRKHNQPICKICRKWIHHSPESAQKHADRLNEEKPNQLHKWQVYSAHGTYHVGRRK